MFDTISQKYNPNPITKFLVVFILSFTILNPIHDISSLMVVVFLSVCFWINGYIKDGIKGTVVFFILYKLPSFFIINELPIYFKMIVSLCLVMRIFYLPFFASKFLIKTSDVGSILSSMDKIKMPKEISIPIAVMFRFFPSYKEERKHIKQAMKIRNISLKNPLLYLEYVTVPLLIISSNIADDIAKASEVKGIENPIAKTRYIQVGVRYIDFVYFGIMLAIVIGGWL